MALDALCGRPQRNFKIDGSHGGLRNGLPAIADFGREFEALQCAENGESDPMHIERPPFVSNYPVYVSSPHHNENISCKMIGARQIMRITYILACY